MSKGNVMLLVSIAIVGVFTGFVVGTVSADTLSPGGDKDPLVTQTYVDKLIGERTAAMQTQIEELQAQLDKSGNGGSTTPDKDTPPDNGTSTSPGTGETPNVGAYKTVEIVSSSVNVRSGPATSYDKVTSAVKGDKFTYLETKSGWYKIKLKDGTVGWVADFVSKAY